MERNDSEDAVPVTPHRSASPPSENARDNLRNRVRSLLVLGNEKFAPETPASSLNYRRSFQDTKGKGAMNSLRKASLKSNRPEAFQDRVPAMAVDSFDGGAGPTEDHDNPASLGINQRHPESSSIYEQDGPTNLPPMPQRSPFNRTSGRYKPHYEVQTLSPPNPRLTDSQSKPDTQHIPGSYTSDSLQNNQLESGPGLTNTQQGGNIDQEDSKPRGSHTILTRSAVESLSHTQDRNRSLPMARSSVRSVRSNTSLKSNLSARALFKPHAARAHPSDIAQPIMTPGFDQSHSHSDFAASRTGARDQVGPPTNPGFTAATGTQISDLLGQLPPVWQTTIEGPDLHHLAPVSLIDSIQPSQRQVSREHSREFSSHDGREDQTFKDRSDLPLKTTEPSYRVPENHKTVSVEKAQYPSDPGTPVSSVSHRAASLHRALTALSDVSSASNGSKLRRRSLRSPRRYEKLDDHTDEPNAQHNAEEARRRSWVQSFTGRSSTMPVPEASSLTAKPSQKQKRDTEPTQSSRSRNMLVPRGSTAASDEKTLQKQSVRDAMKNLAIAKQQEQNADSFSNVIADLENLLEEALIITQQATDDNKTRDEIGHGSHRYHGDMMIADAAVEAPSEGSSSHSVESGEGDHYLSKPRSKPKHERIIIIEPESEERYKGHFRKAREATPYPAATRNASMVPPADPEESINQPSFGGGLRRVNSRNPQESQMRPDPPRSTKDDGLLKPFASKDFAVTKRQTTMRVPEGDQVPLLPRQPTIAQAPLKEQNTYLDRQPKVSSNDLRKPEVQSRAKTFQMRPRPKYLESQSTEAMELQRLGSSRDHTEEYERSDSDDSEEKYYKDSEKHDYMASEPRHLPNPDARRESTRSPLPDRRYDLEDQGPVERGSIRKGRRSHFSIKEPHGFSLSRSHKPAPIARDWSGSRKRWTAFIACLSTALIGLIIGIYAGEVPAIQYAIVDEHHYTILGNVVFFIGMAITTVLFFPLPLLHGRKPYTLAALAILMPLQFPQALAVSTQRTPLIATYRVGLLLPRAIAGLVVGFANINFLSTLLDLFGASLQSSNPHEEMVDINDVRRHGGGMGMWLGIWTWCFIGSIGIGFLIGAAIISGLDVSWGFWITIILTAAVLILNVLAPETRRSAYRRSMAEVRNGGEVSRRVARGEMKMHLDATGPIYWWEEITAGLRLCVMMLKQPGFAVLSLYLGWIYGQIVIVIVVSPSADPSEDLY